MEMGQHERPGLEIIAVRHAVALDAEQFDGPDRERPLTKAGAKKFDRMLARYIAAEAAEPPGIIAASPYKRAQETAAMLAARLECEVRVCTALEPGHTPLGMLRALSALHRRGAPVYAVGHDPSLSHFVSACIGATPAAIALKKGGMAKVRFARGAKLGSGELIWLLTPRILKR